MRSLLVGRDHVGCLYHDPTKEAFIYLTSKVISASALRQRHSPLSPFGSVRPARCARARCPVSPRDIVEAAMAQRQPQRSWSTPTLPPQRAALTLHAAGIDLGAAAHWG